MRKYLGFFDPVLPTSYPLELVKLLTARGTPEAALLDGSTVTSAMLRSPKARLSFEQVLLIIRNAKRVSEPSLGLTFGQRINVSCLGVVGYAAMSQETLRGAVTIAERYHRVLVPQVTLRASIENDVASVAIEPEFPLDPYKPFVMEAITACLVSVAAFLVGRPLPWKLARFDYPDPGYAERYREVLGCPVEFGAPRVELRIALDALQTPLAYACEPTAQMAEELCERELAPLLGQDGIVQKVRSILQAEAERFPNVRELAKTLHTSERSLRRALNAHGTSFQQLRDEVRMRLALQYLMSTATPVEEIARTIGFTSSRSFRRALKRWTGKSPTDVRTET